MARAGAPRKRGDQWEFSYYDADGKRVFERFSSAKEAKAAMHARKAEVDAQRAGLAPKAPTPRTFEELVELWRDVKFRKRSLDYDETNIRLYLEPAFRGMNIADITATHVTRLDRFVSRGRKVGTVRQILGLLRAMLRLAVEHGWLFATPQFRLPKAEDLDYCWIRTEADVLRFLEEAGKIPYPGIVPILSTAVYTGMRAGEICGLRWSDVDFDNRLITVQRSFDQPTKTNAIRRVPILDRLLPVLVAWRAENPSELVFPNEMGKMHVLGARPMKQIFHRVRDAAGLL